MMLNSIKKAFTLAEVLITLTIIGVVAAITIPSVIVNTQNAEFKTGLKKSISVLNSAIRMGIVNSGSSPAMLSSNYTLYDFFKDNLSLLKSVDDISNSFCLSPTGEGCVSNKALYTVDGFRYEFPKNYSLDDNKINSYESTAFFNSCYEDDSCSAFSSVQGYNHHSCGSFGINRSDETGLVPCVLTVDVNGDRKPNPANANCKSIECTQKMKISSPNAVRLSDIFLVMVTDSEAIPYGYAAQKAMYNHSPRLASDIPQDLMPPGTGSGSSGGGGSDGGDNSGGQGGGGNEPNPGGNSGGNRNVLCGLCNALALIPEHCQYLYVCR